MSSAGATRASEGLLQNVSSRRNVRRDPCLKDFDAFASGKGLTDITLSSNPLLVEVLEEFLHGTQVRLGIAPRYHPSLWSVTDRIRVESHVKNFMLRHQKLLGLSGRDVKLVQQTLDLYLGR